MTYNIIVAHFNENLNWLQVFDKNSVIVYSKGAPSSIPCIQKRLYNVGREAHTYLSYIIEYYESLPDIVFFTQGNINEHGYSIKKEDIEKQFLNIEYNSSNFKQWCYTTGMNSQYHITDYKGPLLQFELNGIEFFRKYINSEVDLSVNFRWYFCAIFSVKREAILTRTKEYYQELISTLSKNNAPETAHFMERSWFYVFNLDKYNK